MPIHAELLEILACPLCGGRLTQPNEESLICEQCGHIYSIQDGIPSLIVEEENKQ